MILLFVMYFVLFTEHPVENLASFLWRYVQYVDFTNKSIYIFHVVQ